MKKFLSLCLVAVFVFGGIVPPGEVYGAASDNEPIFAEYDRSLIFDEPSSNTRLSRTPQGTGGVLFEMFTGGGTYTEFVLTIPLADGTIGELIITMKNNKTLADVEFRLPATMSSLLVNVGGVYVSLASYSSMRDPNDKNNINLVPGGYPVFTVVEGRGFDFTVGGYTVKFLWDSDSKNFFFQIDGLNDYTVYECMFTRSSNTGEQKKRVLLLPMFTIEKSTVKPYANATASSIPPSPANPKSNGRTNPWGDNPIPIDRISGEPLVPGDDRVDIEFTIDLKEVLDEEGNRLTFATNSSDVLKYRLDLDVMVNADGDEGLWFRIEDIYGVPKIVPHGKILMSTQPQPIVTREGTVLSVYLYGLKSSVCYLGGTVSCLVGPPDSSGIETVMDDRRGKHSIDEGTLYTYVEYDYNAADNKLIIKQYKDANGTNVRGFYSVYEQAPSAGPPPYVSTFTNGNIIENIPYSQTGGTLEYQLSSSLQSTPYGYAYMIGFTRSSANPVTIPPTVTPEYRSQVLIIEPKSTRYIDTPMAFSAKVVSEQINDNKAILYGLNPGELKDLVLDLEWRFARESTLTNYFNDYPGKELVIDYEFRSYESFLEPPVTVNPNNLITFAKIQLTIKKDDGVISVSYKDIGTPSDPEMAELTGPLTSNGALLDKEVFYSATPSSGSYTARARVNIPEFRKGVNPGPDTGPDEIFHFPGVYFLCVTPTEAEVGGIRDSLSGRESNFDSITLSDISPKEVPPPDNFRADEPFDDKAGFDLRWHIPGKALQDYLRERIGYLLADSKTPVDRKYITDNVAAHLNLYISSDEQEMREDFALYKAAGPYDVDRRSYNNLDIRTDLSNASLPNIGIIDLGTVNFDVSVNSNPPARDTLRSGGIVAFVDIPVDSKDLADIYNPESRDVLRPLIEGVDYTVTLEGLDPNTVYYLYADLNVTIEKDIPPLRISGLSDFITVTVKGDKILPTEKDKIPPAPIVTIDRDTDVGLNEVTVHWSEVIDSGTINYEILRTKKQLDEDLINKTDRPQYDFVTFWDEAALDNNPPDARAGLRTVMQFTADKPEGTLLIYPDFTKEADTADFVPYLNMQNDNPVMPSASKLAMTDKTVYTNQMYFYYVRTVKTTDDGMTLYSVWARATATTDVVQPPINLIINDTVPIDRQKEVVIEFDALPTIDDLDRGLYTFEYQIRKKSENWDTPVVMNAEFILDSYDARGGYTHYLYFIRGFEPDTDYQIRVRVRDMNNDVSQWSDEASFKTEFDQSGYDLEREIESWLKRLEELLRGLLRDPYWVVKSTDSEFVAVYRPDRFNALVRGSVGSAIQLVSPDVDRQTFYIPASALAQANNANKGFVVTRGDMEVILSPGAIDNVYNDTVISINNEIKKKTLVDYYTRIDVTWSNYQGKVNGEDPLSKQAAAKIDIVGTSKQTAAIDKEIEAELSSMQAALLDNGQLYAQVRRNIESGMLDTDFVKYIESIVSGMEQDRDMVASAKLTAAQRGIADVYSLDKPLIVTVRGLDPAASVLGYALEGGEFIPVQAVVMGDKLGMYYNKPGAFIFAGRVIVIPGIENMQNGGNISGIAGKHGLDDFLGADSVIDMNTQATRFMVVSSIARMAGAPMGANAYTWLKDNMGIIISSRNDNQLIQTQEAVYLTMLLYEVKGKTKVSSMRIRNQNIIAGIEGINDKYRPYIKAAFETGIYNNPAMNPKGGITVKDFFEMLGRLDAKLKL